MVGNNIADEIRTDYQQLQALGKESGQSGMLDRCRETDPEAVIPPEVVQLCRRLNANLYFLKGWVSYVRFDKEKEGEKNWVPKE